MLGRTRVGVTTQHLLPSARAVSGFPLTLPTGNILQDTAELLWGPGGGEPGHCGLGELLAGLSPEDEAVPGSAGLGPDNRNWTEVRTCHLPRPPFKVFWGFLGMEPRALCKLHKHSTNELEPQPFNILF